MVWHMETKPIVLGCAYSYPENALPSGLDDEYDQNGITPTIITVPGRGNKPCVIVTR